ncbi:thioredoxin [Paraglaciecola sp.]|uniref:thioredoxin n=1 Tax=Paraglaciecola sp. TaxID=1920173 RepID=UPI003EF373DD
MRNIICWVLIMFSLGCASSEESVHEVTIGEISTKQVLDEFPVFKKTYQSYQPSQKEIAAAKRLTGKSLVVLFGTWCHDSEREVPRLLKLLHVADVELKSLTMRALNYSKQDPDGLHHTYKLEFTPTIILLEGERELGRIIEAPRITLGQDLANMLAQ